MKDVVLDNSVISAYVKIGRLSLLCDVLKGSRVYVPETVHREMIFPEALSAVSSSTNPGGWMILKEVDISGFAGQGIGAGEAGTIKLAKEKNAIPAIDDLNGRKFAAKEGVSIIGTLALLRLSLDRGFVSQEELAVIIKDLEEKDSFRMSDELKQWVLGKAMK
jgi:predicted nucleic acid-binding protein